MAEGTRILPSLVVAVWCLLSPAAITFAQSPRHQEPERGRNAGTYFTTGLAHWQGDIFKRGSLTQWNVNLFDAGYNLTSISIRIDSYARDTFLLLSGFSLGYRKDVIRRVDSGHMFNLTLFRDVNLKVFAVKAGGGMEWGMPSLNFDRTEFDFVPDGTVRYRHTYPDRNVDVPFVGTTTDGALYPFGELSVVQRPGPFLAEAGIRINMIEFNFDDYEVTASDNVTRVFGKRKVPVPYLFVNFGLRLF
jgi:hypothetical protein